PARLDGGDSQGQGRGTLADRSAWRGVLTIDARSHRNSDHRERAGLSAPARVRSFSDRQLRPVDRPGESDRPGAVGAMAARDLQLPARQRPAHRSKSFRAVDVRRGRGASLGSRRMLAAYFAAVLSGAIAQIIAVSIAGEGGGPVIGASGGVFGLL